MMALERLSLTVRPAAAPFRVRGKRIWQRSLSNTPRHAVPAEATAPVSTPSLASVSDEDNDFSSFYTGDASVDGVADFDPATRAKSRTRQLPSSRYKFRPPRYYRGPLHPHQPPPRSDPASREFIPGPFTLPRLQQTYTSTLSHDLMTIFYQHVPPGTPKLPTKPRLRYWNPEDSPYMKNRAPRLPRGSPKDGGIGLMLKPINWWNVPRLERITVSARVGQGATNSAYTHAAGMALQAITGARAKVQRARKGTGARHGQTVAFVQKAGKPIAVTSELNGEAMWHFLSTLTSIVLPKIKEWPGVPGRSGDANGNLQIGLVPDVVATWPELAVNYDAYPPQMIPGVVITLHTSARDDKHMRLLCTGLGIPFKGNHST